MKLRKGIERLVAALADGTKSQRSDAAYRLYWIFWDGEGVRADKKRAMEYLRIAAENGLAKAMYELGWHYDTGTFVRKNIAKTIEWYRKAADKGDAWAMVDLGQIYLDGERGVKKNFVQAAGLFRKAVRKKDELAFFNLGLCYDFGKGVRQSEVLACKYYSEAVRLGDVKAMCNLGSILVDYKDSQKTGVKLMRRAAMRGDNIAQYNLGAWYVNGECGLRKSCRFALIWLRKSAAKGNKKAVKALARLAAEDENLTKGGKPHDYANDV